MSLDSFVKITAVPELFERLQADAEQFRGDLERLQRFVKLAIAEPVVAPALNPVAKEHSLESWLQKGFISREEASAYGDRSISPDPQPSTPVPVEIDPDWMESRARQRLEEEADAAARGMVLTFELMTKQKQSTATSLACALHVMRDASAGFECPQTMVAILRALYGMDAATREAQNNG